jgi:hypothetical protein
MSAHVVHFAINADDVDATRRFYETVFGWRFTAWGPPGFFRISTGGGGIDGALQQRRELVAGGRTIGYECTVAVADVDRIAAQAVAAGGSVVMPRTTIAGVGDLVFCTDPSGNVVGALQPDPAAD